MLDVDVIGAGPAGLTAATILARGGARVRVFEKKHYPCVKLCGEFLSPEGMRAIAKLHGAPFDEVVKELNARLLTRFAWTSRRGKLLPLDLKPGGWAVRRDVLDPWLAKIAQKAGAEIIFGQAGESGNAVKKLWATGKEHDGLKSSFFAVKGYARDTPGTDVLEGRDVILYQLQAGYVGFTRMQNRELSYCALFDRRRTDARWRFGSWKDLCEGVFQTNAALARWIPTAIPSAENQIGAARFDFQSRGPVREGQWFAGDAVQLIPPFVGDGMAMAIEGGELAARALLHGSSDANYVNDWTQTFRKRLRIARILHPLLWLDRMHEPMIAALRGMPLATQWIYSRTRGT